MPNLKQPLFIKKTLAVFPFPGFVKAKIVQPSIWIWIFSTEEASLEDIVLHFALNLLYSKSRKFYGSKMTLPISPEGFQPTQNKHKYKVDIE